MTGSYLRLDDFDDFVEVAQGCTHIFYQVTDLADGATELIAYAGRVYWKGISENKKLEELADMRAKQVIETSDQVFR